MTRSRYHLWLCPIAALLCHLFMPPKSLGLPPTDPAGKGDPVLEVTLTPIATKGLEKPVFITHAGDGSGRLFVLEQPGRIRVVEQGVLLIKPLLDITHLVLSGGERGLLGLAFHPDFRRNGRIYVNYTRKPDGATVLAEFRRGASPNEALRDERILMIVPQPYPNHNGGMVAFGPDGFLYIGLGDGGSGGDPGNRAQNPDELLGKILRIDVDQGDPYGIPHTNPYVGGGGRAEIYGIGFRNPWRFSFDTKTDDLWVADVGQNKWEEIDVVTGGENYGWRVMEGSHCYSPFVLCRTSGLQLPIYEYAHKNGRCSIIGGYVYRGRAMAGLNGQYLYGDFCSGEIFSLLRPSDSEPSREPLLLFNASFRISSFGEDEAGELYVLDHGGGVYRLTPH